MDMKEMEDIVKQEGWTLHPLRRRKREYLYVIRRDGAKFRHVYLAPLAKAQDMSPEQLVALLKLKTA